MNSNTQRRIVATMVLAAGMSASALAGNPCPPEDGTPDPSSGDVQTIQLPGGGTLKVRSSMAKIRTADGNKLVAFFGHPQGAASTLETRVYKPGEAAAIYGLQPATGANVFRMSHVVKDGHDVRVVQRGGKITATIDGKEAPSDAVTVKDGTIEVRDADGKTVLKDEWPEAETGLSVGRGHVGAFATPVVPPGVTWTGPMDEEAAPKVMLGITMESADDEIIDQLNLPKGDYAMIKTVPEGLPAAKAGLQPKDIIVSVDGKTPASMGAIREVMKDKKAGDKVTIEVARKGNRVKTDVALEAFDGNRFGAYAQTMGEHNQTWQKYSEKMAKEMQEHAKELSGVAKDQDMQALRERFKLAIPRGQNGEPMILMDRGEDAAKLEDRLNAMEAQLQRLEELLKKLESRGEQTTPAGGGSGTPKPFYAAGL